LVLACGLALLPAAVPATASAYYTDTHYATVGLWNDTTHVIHYQFRWGTDGDWDSEDLLPGNTMVHYWNYSYPNEHHSPTPYIRFDIGGGAYTQEYDLDAYASSNTGYESSNHYVFRYRGEYLDLYHGD